MAPGAGWSALGAAILGGQNAFRQYGQDQQQKLEQQSKLKSEGLQQQLLAQQLAEAPMARQMSQLRLQQEQDKVNELPQQHAENDFARTQQALGEDWRSSPDAVALASKAGITLPTQTPILPSQKLDQNGSMGPMDTDAQRSAFQGVAPNTHVTLPSELLLKQKDEALKGKQDAQAADLADIQNRALKQAFSGQPGQPGAGGGFTTNPDGTPANTPRNRQLSAMMGPKSPFDLDKLYGPAGQDPANVSARKKAELDAELAANPGRDWSVHQSTDPTTQQQSFFLINKTTGERKAVGGGGGGQASPAGVAQFGDDKPHGDEFLKTLDPKTASAVKQLTEYKGVLPSGTALKSPYWQNLLTVLAPQYDPTFDATNYKVRADMKKDFTVGTTSKNLGALNVAANHINRLAEAMKGLNNTNFTPANTVKNTASQLFGQGAVPRYNLVAGASAGELANIFKANGATDPEIQHFMQAVGDSSMGPEGQKVVIDEALHLMKARADWQADRWTRAMGKPPQSPILSPETQATLDKLAGGGKTPVGSPAAAGAQPIVVVDPNGTPHPFATQAQADAFKQAAGIK